MYKAREKSLVVAGLSVLLMAPNWATAGMDSVVNLSWAPLSQNVPAVGMPFTVGMIARSGTAVPEGFSVMESVLTWNPNIIRLQGVTFDGPYEFLQQGFSGFYNDTVFDGLNATFLDGNAVFRAASMFSPPPATAPVPPQSLHIATFNFQSVGAGTTQINMPLTFGNFSQTVVLDAQIPGLDILGFASSATVSVVPEPATAGMVMLLAAFAFRKRGGLSGMWRKRRLARS